MPAGEKQPWRSRHVYHSTETHTAAIGDEEGHLITFFASRGIGFLEEGKTYQIDTHGYMDAYEMSASGQGYAEFTFADGATVVAKWQAEKEGAGEWTGSMAFVKGTGGFAGLEGGGTLQGYFVASDLFYADVVAEYSVQGQGD